MPNQFNPLFQAIDRWRRIFDANERLMYAGQDADARAERDAASDVAALYADLLALDMVQQVDKKIIAERMTGREIDPFGGMLIGNPVDWSLKIEARLRDQRVEWARLDPKRRAEIEARYKEPHQVPTDLRADGFFSNRRARAWG